MSNDESSSSDGDVAEVVYVYKSTLDEDPSNKKMSSAHVTPTSATRRLIKCCAGSYCMVHDHTIERLDESTQTCVRCKGGVHGVCRSRYQDLTMNLTVCIKCDQENGKSTSKQIPNVVDNTQNMPSSPTGSDEMISPSPARKKIRKESQQPKCKPKPKTKLKKNDELTLKKVGELLATQPGRRIFAAMYRQARASELGLHSLIQPNKNTYFSTNISKWYGTMGFLFGYEKVTARTLKEKFSKAMAAAQDKVKLTHASDKAGTQAKVWSEHLNIAYEFMQFMDQLGEEKEAGKEKRAKVKKRQSRLLGGPRSPIGQPGQQERDTADPSRHNKAYSRDVTTNDSENLQFEEQSITNAETFVEQGDDSVIPLGTRS